MFNFKFPLNKTYVNCTYTEQKVETFYSNCSNALNT